MNETFIRSETIGTDKDFYFEATFMIPIIIKENKQS